MTPEEELGGLIELATKVASDWWTHPPEVLAKHVVEAVLAKISENDPAEELAQAVEWATTSGRTRTHALHSLPAALRRYRDAKGGGATELERLRRLEQAAREVLDRYWPEFAAALKGLKPERRAAYLDGPLGHLRDALGEKDRWV